MMDNLRQWWTLWEKVLGKRDIQRGSMRNLLIIKGQAGNENRTRIASLEGWSFTIKLCPHKSNGKQGCHEVAGSQAVFSARLAMQPRNQRRLIDLRTALACIAHKSLEIFERCGLWQRNFQLRWRIPLPFAEKSLKTVCLELII